MKLGESLRENESISPTLFRIFIHTGSNWNKSPQEWVNKLDKDQKIQYILFEDDQVLITQKYEDMEFMVKNLLEKYEKWV